ncbi:hypothetical protein J7T55_000504 [Diaporthe amygdali]|uniref:uncharacterized protein n=1 Tax=Phomopsis amygdali TaxID=1214568 RepID=UPI0022FF0A27|nr:uncharacterized protein J7T55_000504 [Diaporthe amygdali]KAJ0104153.1 hypothetical protein J7T55_000504 [Diaporthe amygdali]
MCLIFTCGEHTFRKEVEGYQGVVCQCHNCGNYSGHVIKTHPWFTFCFIPVIPLSMKGYEDVTCHICNFAQPLQARPDVQSMKRDGEGGGVPLQQQPPPQQGPPPGWNGQSPPQPEPNQGMRYG